MGGVPPAPDQVQESIGQRYSPLVPPQCTAAGLFICPDLDGAGKTDSIMAFNLPNCRKQAKSEG